MFNNIIANISPGIVMQGTQVNQTPNVITDLSTSFTVDTILGQLDWTDTNAGAAEYEVYSSTNGAADVLLATTAAGATSYQDTTCKQNASVVYKVRAKKAAVFSDLVAATALVTPLCWKSNQSTLTNHVLNTLDITAGKTVTVNYSDGTSQAYTGNNSNITKSFAATGQYNVWLTGDVDWITVFQLFNQTKIYGNSTNWMLPSKLTYLGIRSIISISGNPLAQGIPSLLSDIWMYAAGTVSGDLSSLIVKSVVTSFHVYQNGNYIGYLPQIEGHSTNGIGYNASECKFSDSNVTVFRKAMTIFNISNQSVSFSTANIDKQLKALADWYEVNAPTANCTFTMNGANMGIPTGGASNTDLVRLVGYYTAAGRTATVVVRTS